MAEEITLDFLERERIAIMWRYGKPQAARYMPFAPIHWYFGDTIGECVQALLADEERRRTND